MAHVRLEFTVEPFVPGHPGPHVRAAIEAVQARGLAVEIGPFSSVAGGETDEVAAAARDLVAAAVGAGASRLAVQIEPGGHPETVRPEAAHAAAGVAGAVDDRPARHPLLTALEPVVDAVGGALVADASRIEVGDIPLVWDGETVGAFRRPHLHGALDRLIEQVERELGGKLPALSREDKQEAVRLLDDRGAFLLRRSVELIADALGVSRITVYNYLNAIR